MVTVEFALRDQRVAHLAAILGELRARDGFGPEREAALLTRLRAAGPGDHRVVLRSTPGTFTVDTSPLAATTTDRVVLDAAGVPDQRTHPVLPGPDRGWQAHELARTRRDGAGESVLLDDEGAVISALASPLLVIEAANVHVSAHPRATPSVMLGAVAGHMSRLGLQLIEQPGGFTMSRLRSGEVWVLDPVSGIQLVTGWLEYGSIVGARTLPARIAPDHRAVEAWRWATASPLGKG